MATLWLIWVVLVLALCAAKDLMDLGQRPEAVDAEAYANVADIDW